MIQLDRGENRLSARQKQAADFADYGKVLNLCGESKCRGAVMFLAVAQNKFIICLRLSAVDWNFRTTYRHYADK